MSSEIPEEQRHDQDTGITEIREQDVICGRGGAALRHAGNQTYRRLVNLNKGLYITCLKTEKLKISRSIVAAIREQNGRFLEKDATDESWYDIGDKKAIEKTSQALRENQPKLRQKIVEMGGGVAGTAAFMESQYGHPGIYNPEQVGLTPVSLDSTSRGSSAVNAVPQHQVQHQVPTYHPQQEMHTMQPLQVMHPSHQYHGDTNPDAMLSRLTISENPRGSSSFQQPYPAQSMQPMQTYHRMAGSPSHQTSGGMMAGTASNPNDRYGRSNMAMDMAQRGSQNPHNMQQRVQRLRPSLYSRDSHSGKELGFPLQMDSNISLMSEISQFGSGEISQFASGEFPVGATAGNEGQRTQSHVGERYNGSAMPSDSFHMDSSFKNKLASMSLPDHSTHLDSTSTHSMDISAHNPIPLAAAQEGSSSVRNNNYAGSYIDRREILRTMKYSRPSSESKSQPYSQANLNDDMHMLESNRTTMSGSSNMTGFSEEKDFMSKKSAPYVPPKPLIETAKVVDHSRLGDTLRSSRHGDLLAADSRHSIMSGLSRISDTSFDQSIFSDLSRKIGNVSTRSLTPSEISAMDMQERLNEDDGSEESHRGDPSETEVTEDANDL